MGLINWGKQLQFTQKGAITQQTGCDWWKTLEQHFPDTMVLTVDQDVTVDLGQNGQITLKGGQALMAWDLNISSLTIIPTQSTNYSCVAFAAVDPLDKIVQRVRIPRIQIAGAKTPALDSAGTTQVNVSSSQDLSVVFINVSSSTTVGISQTETVTVLAPAGYIYQALVIRLYVGAPGGAASGTHELGVLSQSQAINALIASSTYASEIEVDSGVIITANNTKRPTTEAGQVVAMKDLLIDSTNGLDIKYSNATNVAQTNARTIKLWVRKIKVV